MARKKTTKNGENRKPAKKSPPLAAGRHQDPPVRTQEPALTTREDPAPAPAARKKKHEASSPAEELEELRAAERATRASITDFAGRAGQAEGELLAIRGRIAELEKVVLPSEPGWHFWPDGEALPEHYVKMRRDPQPCRNPECRRRYTRDGGQAVVCLQSGGATASFRCMVCRHSFTLPVKVLKP